MPYSSVGEAAQLADGAMREVMVKGHEVLIARVGDSIYAVDGRCPHIGGKLAQGRMEGTIVTRPRHDSRFDMINGSVVQWLQGLSKLSRIETVLKSLRPLLTYNVRVKQGEILVDV